MAVIDDWYGKMADTMATAFEDKYPPDRETWNDVLKAAAEMGASRARLLLGRCYEVLRIFDAEKGTYKELLEQVAQEVKR